MGDIDEALLELQRQGVIIGAGGMWLPGHAEIVECYNPAILEQLLNPGEFVEVDVDELIAELEAMLVKAGVPRARRCLWRIKRLRLSSEMRFSMGLRI